MYKRTIFAVLTTFFASAILAQAYKWVDEDGVVHYSDRPHEGAVEMQLPDDGIRPPPPRYPTTSSSRAGGADDAAELEQPTYEAFNIVSPAAEETLWNIGGVLDVRLNMQPALQRGHRLHIYLDGLPRIVNTTSFQLDEVHRGEHVIQAEIVDQSGTMVVRSQATTFYVQQTSVLRPPAN